MFFCFLERSNLVLAILESLFVDYEPQNRCHSDTQVKKQPNTQTTVDEKEDKA